MMIILNEAKKKKPKDEEDNEDIRYELDDEPDEEEPEDDEEGNYDLGDEEEPDTEETPTEDEPVDNEEEPEDNEGETYDLGNEEEPATEETPSEDNETPTEEPVEGEENTPATTDEPPVDEDDEGGTYDLGDDNTTDEEEPAEGEDTGAEEEEPEQNPNYIDINNIEHEISSQILNDKEITIRKNSLKKLFKSVYESIDQYITKLTDLSVADLEEEKQIDEVINQLKEAKMMVIDYIADSYDNASYTENLAYYYQYVALLENIFVIIKGLNEKHK